MFSLTQFYVISVNGEAARLAVEVLRVFVQGIYSLLNKLVTKSKKNAKKKNIFCQF